MKSKIRYAQRKNLINKVYKEEIDLKIKNPLKSVEKHNEYVILKSLNDSSNINENFLNKVSGYISTNLL